MYQLGGSMNNFFNVVENIKLSQIVELVGAQLLDSSKGDEIVSNLGSLENANENSIIYLILANSTSQLLNKSAEYKEKLKLIKAKACFIKKENVDLLPKSIIPLVVDDPKLAFIKLTNFFYKDKALDYIGISSNCVIDDSVQFKDKNSVSIGHFSIIEKDVVIGKNCHIGNGVKIKPGVVIGDNCIIKDNAVVSHTVMGNNVKINEGACIGGDGFGWHSGSFGHIWVPQIGRVVLEDDVDVGVNSSIDRGTIGDTVIGKGTKIDNLIQIGHNVKTGKNCIFAGMCGVAGSTIIGDGVLVGAGAGISGHLHIGDYSQIGAGSGVIQDLPPKSVVSGYPAQPVHDFLKQTALMRKLIKKGKF